MLSQTLVNLILWFTALCFQPFLYLVSIILRIVAYFKNQRLPGNLVAPQQPETIFITGGSTGIGEGLAKHYAWNVKSVRRIIITGRNSSALESVKKEIESKINSVKVITMQCDVTDKQKMKQVIDSCDKLYDIDIVIANAGIAHPMLSHIQDPLEIDQQIWEINIMGVMNTFHPIISRWKVRADKQKSKQLVVMGSPLGYCPIIGGSYGSSKSVVHNYARHMRMALTQDNICVNTIYPMISTRMSPSKGQSLFQLLPEEGCAKICDALKQNVETYTVPPVTMILPYVIGMLPYYFSEPFHNIVEAAAKKAHK